MIIPARQQERKPLWLRRVRHFLTSSGYYATAKKHRQFDFNSAQCPIIPTSRRTAESIIAALAV